MIAARVEREFDFQYVAEDVVLRGQIDLWFEEGDELVVVDFKTEREDPATEDARNASHSLQLRLYALALEHYVGRLPDRAYLHYLRADRVAPVALTPDDLTAAIRDILSFRQAQERLEFPLREGTQCLRCPFYQGRCPAGR